MEHPRPLFIVGTLTEVGAVEAAGHEAQTTQGMDASQLADLALSLAAGGRTAIIMLNDEATAQLADACEQAGAAYRTTDGPNSTDKLFSMFSIASDDGKEKTEFEVFLDREEAEATQQAELDRAEAHRRQLEALGVHDVFDVVTQISSGQADRVHIPTGIETLDEALGGGLPEGGLVTLGATSSTGKTTLCLQVADNIAAGGRPVLFVTVEQGRHELVAKSLSRLVRLTNRRHGWYSVGASEVMNAARRAEWDSGTGEAFISACATYSATISPNMRIMETDRQPTTAQIRKAAEAMRRFHAERTAPVVVVDYLQLLAPANDRMTERQAVDHNVMDMRHLARDLKTCVVVISSLNRSSYSTGVTMEAFKESGAIEFGSDVLLGMQPRGLADRLTDLNDSKQKQEARKIERAFRTAISREVEVVILKNRGGAVNADAVPLDYDAKCNLFTAGSASQTAAGRKPVRL